MNEFYPFFLQQQIRCVNDVRLRSILLQCSITVVASIANARSIRMQRRLYRRHRKLLHRRVRRRRARQQQRQHLLLRFHLSLISSISRSMTTSSHQLRFVHRRRSSSIAAAAAPTLRQCRHQHIHLRRRRIQE